MKTRPFATENEARGAPQTHGASQDSVENPLQKALRIGKGALPSSLTAWLSPAGNAGPSNPPGAATLSADIDPAVGAVRFGDLARTTPVDSYFGFARGTPIDRFYIESFLDRNRGDIAGRVLEVGNAIYSRAFGGERVTRQDVLHLRPNNPEATIVGDLTSPDVLPREAFDCIVFTQTLQFIYDLRAAVAQLHAALKPGGVILATLPGISQIDPAVEWEGTWYWSFSRASAWRLLTEAFDPGSVSIESHGNVFAALSLLHGIASEEAAASQLLVEDGRYPVILTLRAQKRV